MRRLFRSPPFVRFICGRMWCRRVLPAALPAPFSATLSPALWVYLCKCGTAGSASARTACAICPTLRQSQSCHSHASPLHPGARLRPSYPSGCVYFLFPWYQSPLLFDSLSVLVVRGGTVCLPTPPSWFSQYPVILEDLFLLLKVYLSLENQDGSEGRHTAPPRTTRTEN